MRGLLKVPFHSFRIFVQVEAPASRHPPPLLFASQLGDSGRRVEFPHCRIGIFLGSSRRPEVPHHPSCIALVRLVALHQVHEEVICLLLVILVILEVLNDVHEVQVHVALQLVLDVVLDDLLVDERFAGST